MDSIYHYIGDLWSAVSLFFAFDTSLLTQKEMVIRLIVQCFLFVLSAFFSSSETALFSLSRLDLQQLRRESHPRAELIHEMLDQPRRLIISILTGCELVNIAASANMAVIIFSLYGVEKGVWINLLVMVPLLLLLSEVTPKTIAVANPMKYSAGVVAAPLAWWIKFISPLQWVVRRIADVLTTLMIGESKSPDSLLKADEFLSLVEQVSEEGGVDATERALIYNLLEANDTEIVEVMTPRTRMSFINIEMSPSEMIKKFIAYRHPRVPVFRTHRDNIVGFLHAEDILKLVSEQAKIVSIEEILRPPVVVPLTKKVDEMFDFFQDHRARAAICLNEFGGVEGFITMRGVLNFIFGDISGGSKATEGLYQKDGVDVYDVPGEMKLTDLNNLTNFGLEDPRMTTIGGVAFRLLDRLPTEGDQVAFDDITIQILQMDVHRIAKVRISKGVDAETLTDSLGEIPSFNQDIDSVVAEHIEEPNEGIQEDESETTIRGGSER